MSFDAEPQRLAAKVMAATIGRLLGGAMRRTLAQDLEDISAAAEGATG